MAMVFAAEGLNAAEKVLLLAYANRADAHGYCWPSVDRLADDTGMSVRTVKRTNAQLRERNLIKAVHRADRKTGLQISNLTRLNAALLASMRRPDRDYDDNVVEQITFEVPAGTESAFPQVSQGCQSDPPRGANLTPPGCQSVAPRGANLAPKPSLEPSLEPSSSSASAPETGPAPDFAQEEEGGTAKTNDRPDLAEAFAIVDAATAQWDGHRLPTASERLRLAQRAADALAKGSGRIGIHDALTRDLEPSRTRSAVAVVMTRTAQAGWGELPAVGQGAAATRPALPPKCDDCDDKRMVELLDGRMRRCPACHPLANRDAEAGPDDGPDNVVVLDVIDLDQDDSGEGGRTDAATG